MGRLFNTALVRGLRAADCWLCSLGLALLVLSVLLVPTSRVLGDDGGGGPLAPISCLAANGCSNGCAKDSNTLNCNAGMNGQDNPTKCSWTMKGCNGCTCRGCTVLGKGYYCNCQCQSYDAGCTGDVNSPCKANSG